MQLRHVACIITILSLSALSACRGKSNEDSVQAAELLSAQESEPNNTREQCSKLGDHERLHGILAGADIDVICADDDSVLEIEAPASVAIALESPEGQRVELGPGNGQLRRVEFPSSRWVLELRGEGEWLISRPSDEEEPQPFCGIRLGTAGNPVVLGVQSLPAEFPLCVDASNGTAKILFPSMRPDGVAGFEMRVDGLDDQVRGVLRVHDDEVAITHTELVPGKRLPALRWLPESMLQGELRIAHSDGPKTVYLRIEAVSQPKTTKEILELEPNDAESNAVPVTAAGVAAGSLYHLQDIDRFRVAEFAGDLGIELVAQANTKLRVLSSSEQGSQDAVLGEDGVYRICSLGVAPMTPVDVRVAYADTVDATDGIYELSFVPAASKTDEPVRKEPVSIPFGEPRGAFGFTVPLEEGQPNLRGRIFPPDDVDEWIFQVPQSNEDFHVEIDVKSKSAMDVKLRVLDADRVVVATADRGAAGQSERLELELPSGFYILELRATGVSGCEGAYELGISSPNARTAEPDAPNHPQNGGWNDVHGDNPPQYLQRVPDEGGKDGPKPPENAANEDRPAQAPATSRDDVAPAYPW